MQRCILAIAFALLAQFVITSASFADDVFIYATRGDKHIRFVSAADLSPHDNQVENLPAKLDIALGAHELAVSPDGRWAIGTAYGGPGNGHNPPDKRVAVIDMRKRTLHRIVELTTERWEFQRPNDIAFLPDSSHAIITVEVPPQLIKLNPETGEFTSIEVGAKANHMLALHPSGKTAYVAHVMPGSVSVVDLSTGETTATIDTPVGAEGIACSPDGKQVWVACNRSDVICIIDTQTNLVSRTIIAKGFPFRMKFAADGKTVAVSFPAASEVRLFETADPKKVKRINLRREAQPEEPVQCTSIAFSPDGTSLAVVCDGQSPELVRIDLKDAKVTHRISAAGTIPDGLASGR